MRSKHMEKDAQDWVIWTAALRHAEHSERMRHPPVAMGRPEETGRGARRSEAAGETAAVVAAGTEVAP